MALIKCTECGKEISTKAEKCIHCGYPLDIETPKEEKKEKRGTKKVITGKSLIINGIILIFTLGIGIALSFLIENPEIMFYTIGLTTGLQFSIAFLLYYLDNGKIKHKWFNVFLILQVISLIWFIISVSVVYNYVYNDLYGDLGYIKENYTKDEIEEILDTRTPKEKMIDYLKEHNNAVCDSHKCTYIFEVYGIDSTTYYTLDFDNKTFSSDNYDYGTNHDEYNYGNNTGYSKMVETTVWATTTETYVTFNEDGSYTYTCNSDLPGFCEELNETCANTIISTKDVFMGDCSRAGVNPSDL